MKHILISFIVIIVSIDLILAGPQIVSTISHYLNPPTQNQSQDNIPAALSESQARAIAEASCIKGGQALRPGIYNGNSKTWWFDANLNATKPGCIPACVVFENKTTEIDWRCTGAVPPENNNATSTCPEEMRDGNCTRVYNPVCATVQIQCIKAPCNPVQQTFSNACEACLNPLVSEYVGGECNE